MAAFHPVGFILSPSNPMRRDRHFDPDTDRTAVDASNQDAIEPSAGFMGSRALGAFVEPDHHRRLQPSGAEYSGKQPPQWLKMVADSFAACSPGSATFQKNRFRNL
jgi:hypothetical protein